MPMEKWIEIDGAAARSWSCAALRNQGDLARRYGNRPSRVWVGAMAWAPSDLGQTGSELESLPPSLSLPAPEVLKVRGN